MTQPLLSPDGGGGCEGSPEPPLLTAAAVAARLADPVTAQTIRNWHARGMKRQGKIPLEGRPGEWVDGFTVEAVEKWRAENRGGRVGGKRTRAGRPKGGSKAARTADLPLVAAAQAAQGEDQVKANQEAAEREKKAKALLEARAQIMSGQAGIDLLIALATTPEELGGASRSELDRIAIAIKAAKDQQELAQRRGELVEAAAVRAEWATLLTNLRGKLEALPARVSPVIASEAGLRVDQVTAASAAIDVAVKALIREMQTEAEEEQAVAA